MMNKKKVKNFKLLYKIPKKGQQTYINNEHINMWLFLSIEVKTASAGHFPFHSS